MAASSFAPNPAGRLLSCPEFLSKIPNAYMCVNPRPGISRGTQTDNLIYKSIIIITLHTYKRKENSSGINGLAMASAPLPQAAQLGYKPNVFSFWILYLQLRFDDYCKNEHMTYSTSHTANMQVHRITKDGIIGFHLQKQHLANISEFNKTVK
ncbi:hypothetical protein EII45_28545 [Klebsiella pneumoniae]|nr:hypothetical protein [Klebsiella pneumoniae]